MAVTSEAVLEFVKSESASKEVTEDIVH